MERVSLPPITAELAASAGPLLGAARRPEAVRAAIRLIDLTAPLSSASELRHAIAELDRIARLTRRQPTLRAMILQRIDELDERLLAAETEQTRARMYAGTAVLSAKITAYLSRHGAARTSELASAFGKDSQDISRALRQLVEAGTVICVETPIGREHDGRARWHDIAPVPRA